MRLCIYITLLYDNNYYILVIVLVKGIVLLYIYIVYKSSPSYVPHSYINGVLHATTCTFPSRHLREAGGGGGMCIVLP